MSWFKKLFTVGTNVVNEKMESVTESLVDIKREGNGLIKQLDNDIKALHSRVVDAQKEVQLSQYEICKNLELIANLERVALKAVQSNNDEDAVQALSRVEGLELISKTHQQTIDILQPIIDQQIEHIKKMVSEQQLLKAEITRLDLEERQYKIRAKLIGDNVVDKGGVDINYLRERVNKARATCEAKEIINSKVSLEVTPEVTTSESVNKRLEDLKKKA
jgi:phage shock protein A